MRYLIYFLAFCILCCTIFLERSFGYPTLEEIIFEIRFSKQNIGSIPRSLIILFTYGCIIIPLVCTFVTLVVEKTILMLVNKKLIVYLKNSLFLTFANKAILSKLPIYFLIFTIYNICYKFSFYASIEALLKPEQLIIPAQETTITPTKPKNLVLIYLESMETSYSSTSLFSKNLLAKLDSHSGVTFLQYKPAPQINRTIAAIVATQCGVPIKIDYLLPNDNNNIICLGDILNKFGYLNVFMGGASLNYSSKGLFFSKHHYNERYGREEWLSKGETELNGWGIYDNDLFKQAKTKIKELQDSGKLFNLTLLTIETHFPGFNSKYCEKQGFKEFEGIIECSSHQVSDFIDFIKQNGYDKNTNIVVIGDHLLPLDWIFKNKSRSKRFMFNKFISTETMLMNRTSINHFDIFPTILDFIGLKLKDGHLGLGYSGFSKP